MKFRESRYVRVNKLFLSLAGLWPYEDSRQVRIQRIVSFLMILSGPIVQITTLITWEYSLNLILEVMSTTIIGTIFAIEYLIFLCNIGKVKALFDKVEDIWWRTTCKKECAILTEYAEKGLYLTVSLILLVCPTVCSIVLSGLSSNILDIFIPLNHSRPKRIPFLVEYFVDHEKYFYFILAHIALFTVLGGFSMVAIETTFMVFLQQACGFYKIVCYRIEDATMHDTLGVSEKLREVLIREKMINAITLHNRTLEFCDCLRSSFTILYFIVLSLGVASLSINLYNFYLSISVSDGMEKLVICVMILIAHFGYILYGNYAGQEMMNHSSDIFMKSYTCMWYTTPSSVRKMILVLMQRSMKTYSLTLGGIFVPSLEGFTTVTSMALSYFMFLYSTQ